MSLLAYSSELLKHAGAFTQKEGCGLSIVTAGNAEIQKMIQEFEREVCRSIKAGDIINGVSFSLICVNCTSQSPDVLKIKKTNLMANPNKEEKNVH